MNDEDVSAGGVGDAVVGGVRDDSLARPETVGASVADNSGAAMSLVMRIPVSMEVVLGRAQMPLSKLMKLSRGAIVTLDRKVGEVVDVVVNNRVVARGEVIVLDEAQSRFGVCLTEVASISAEDMEA